MNSKLLKTLSVLSAAALLAGSFTACGKKQGEAPKDNTPAPTGQTSSSTYPVKTNVTLKYWVGLAGQVSATAANLGDTPLAKELEKKTGIKIEYQHPAVNQAKEQLNIMLASGELPDIIEYDWLNFPGGPEKAIKDGYILKLNETIDKYAPNLKKYLNANPEVNKMVKTDAGSYYVFPFIRGDDLLMVFNGPMIRKDWLDELGLQVPATLDEWYTVLKAFKEKKNAEAPFSIITVPASGGAEIAVSDFIFGAYGISRSFYADNGKVKYGPAEAAFKDVISVYRKWYAEGLIDKNLATVDTKVMDANVASGKTGALTGYNGGTLGKYLTSMQEKDPKFNLVAAPYPSLKKGETVKFGQMDLPYSPGGSAAITTKSKNVEIAARFLDYGYGDEGRLVYNFGVEGESYKMENGQPKYTDIILNNPDKLPITNAMGRYIRAIYSGPFIQDKGYITQYLALPQQKEALTVWSKTEAAKTKLPRITPTPEESSEYAKIYNEVDAFVNETFFKMVLGAEPIENFDKYMEKLKKMNIDRAIEIQQNALDRYGKR